MCVVLVILGHTHTHINTHPQEGERDNISHVGGVATSSSCDARQVEMKPKIELRTAQKNYTHSGQALSLLPCDVAVCTRVLT